MGMMFGVYRAALYVFGTLVPFRCCPCQGFGRVSRFFLVLGLSWRHADTPVTSRANSSDSSAWLQRTFATTDGPFLYRFKAKRLKWKSAPGKGKPAKRTTEEKT